MAQPEERADLIRSIAAEAQSTLGMCRQGLLGSQEAADYISSVWPALLSATVEGSVEWRIFDKASRQTPWWTRTLDGYVDPKDCRNFEVVKQAIDDVLSASTGSGLKDYWPLLEKAETLKSIITVRATSLTGDERGYSALRGALLADAELAPLMPRLVRTSRSLAEIWTVMRGVANGTGAYALRREFIRKEFDPVLSFLESKSAPGAGSPHSDLVGDALDAFGVIAVGRLWNKALSRIDTDPDGALTAARSLVETVCKHILDDANADYADGDDAPTLLKKAYRAIGLAPKPKDDQSFKQVASGCVSVITGVSAIANEYGDRHGSDSDSVPASRHHVELVVNLAGSLALFLTEAFIRSRQGAR